MVGDVVLVVGVITPETAVPVSLKPLAPDEP